MWNPFKKTSPDNGQDHCWHSYFLSREKCCYCGITWAPDDHDYKPLRGHGSEHTEAVYTPKPTGPCPKR